MAKARNYPGSERFAKPEPGRANSKQKASVRPRAHRRGRDWTQEEAKHACIMADHAENPARDQGRLRRPSPRRQHAAALHRFPGEGTSPQRRRVPAMMGLNLLVLYQAESATKPTTKSYVRPEQC